MRAVEGDTFWGVGPNIGIGVVTGTDETEATCTGESSSTTCDGLEFWKG